MEKKTAIIEEFEDGICNICMNDEEEKENCHYGNPR
jgi:hypothetical protein